MAVAERTALRCERCGEPLASGASQAGGCLNCLLLDALAQPPHREVLPGPPLPLSPPVGAASGVDTAQRYQHYEILTREDGSLLELGRGAMG